jgi:hypothetical protein
MQLNSVYLYPNKIDVFTNMLADWTTERYRRVYNRNLKVYHSVDNRIDLQVRNADQKAATIAGTALVFNIITREGKDLVFSKDCVINSNTLGRAYVTISASEMTALDLGLYNYSITQEVRTSIDNNNYTVSSRTPLYQDSQYGTIGVLEVSGDVLGDGEQSLEINKFKYVNPATTGYTDPAHYISSIVDTVGNTQVAQSLHTFQFYFSNNYTGNIRIQGSLDEGGTPDVWTDLSNFDVTDQNSPVYQNVVGKYNFLRIKHYPSRTSNIAEFVVTQTIFGYYEVFIREGGRGYHVGDVITIVGRSLGGETPGQDLTITVTTVNTVGRITGISHTGVSYNGVKTYVVNGELPTSGTIDKILYR